MKNIIWLTLAFISASLVPFEALAGEDQSDNIELADDELADDEVDQVLTVRTTVRALGPRHAYQPTTRLQGDELQRNLGSSVPATLEGVPGFHAQFNGPGASSPTLRGMPGDRVLMLEDGHRTGDIYWTASDHGVMAEPISAQYIDVIRGPAGLLFGSNALGGSVNIVREDVPTSAPTTLQATATTQFESVNNGFSSGLVLRGPAGPLAFYGEASARRSGDTRTPLGTLDQSSMAGFNLAGGLSWVGDEGFLGASTRYFESSYAVPGEFNGEMIPGGHPGGVSIDVQRWSSRIHGSYNVPSALFERLEVRSRFTRFDQEEIEGVVGDQTVIGARFLQFTSDSHLLAHQKRRTLGVSLQTRDLEAGGASPGTRSGTERGIGALGFQEIHHRSLRFQVGLRADMQWVDTPDHSPLRTRTSERTIEKEVASRTFGGVSGSAAALWDFAEDWTVGVSLARSFRSPNIEELYSDGPHLADFSFDIGNPDLGPEIGHGADLFLRAELPRLALEAATYVNHVNQYIYYNPTGETVRVFTDRSSPRITPVFEARGEDALFVGAEGRLQWEVFRDLLVDLSASYTQATRVAESDPLPFIPPLSGRVELRYEGSRIFGSLGMHLAAPQNRVPRPISVGDALQSPERPTDGYGLTNALLGLRHSSELMDHTVMLQARNLFNQVSRDHLSRIKDIAPQPGRNIQVTYQLHF